MSKNNDFSQFEEMFKMFGLQKELKGKKTQKGYRFNDSTIVAIRNFKRTLEDNGYNIPDSDLVEVLVLHSLGMGIRTHSEETNIYERYKVAKLEDYFKSKKK